MPNYDQSTGTDVSNPNVDTLAGQPVATNEDIVPQQSDNNDPTIIDDTLSAERQGGEDDYPEQRHAGQVGIGPNFHAGPTMSDKFTGIKEQIYGKVTGKPDLVETGQLRQTGELKRREHAEQDEKSPFQNADDGNTIDNNQKVFDNADQEE